MSCQEWKRFCPVVSIALLQNELTWVYWAKFLIKNVVYMMARLHDSAGMLSNEWRQFFVKSASCGRSSNHYFRLISSMFDPLLEEKKAYVCTAWISHLGSCSTSICNVSWLNIFGIILDTMKMIALTHVFWFVSTFRYRSHIWQKKRFKWKWEWLVVIKIYCW